MLLFVLYYFLCIIPMRMHRIPITSYKVYITRIVSKQPFLWLQDFWFFGFFKVYLWFFGYFIDENNYLIKL